MRFERRTGVGAGLGTRTNQQPPSTRLWHRVERAAPPSPAGPQPRRARLLRPVQTAAGQFGAAGLSPLQAGAPVWMTPGLLRSPLSKNTPCAARSAIRQSRFAANAGCRQALRILSRNSPQVTDFQPRNRSWTRPSGLQFGALARRDDAAGRLPARRSNAASVPKCGSIGCVALSPAW